MAGRSLASHIGSHGLEGSARRPLPALVQGGRHACCGGHVQAASPGLQYGGGVRGSGGVPPEEPALEVQGAQLLTAVSYVGSIHRNRGRRLVAFFGCILYAAMRPAEAVGLRLADCDLPEQGGERSPFARRARSQARSGRIRVRATTRGDSSKTAQSPSRPSWWPCSVRTWGNSARRRTVGSFPMSEGTCSAHPATGVCGRRSGHWPFRRTRLPLHWDVSRTTCEAPALRTGSVLASPWLRSPGEPETHQR